MIAPPKHPVFSHVIKYIIENLKSDSYSFISTNNENIVSKYTGNRVFGEALALFFGLEVDKVN